MLRLHAVSQEVSITSPRDDTSNALRPLKYAAKKVYHGSRSRQILFASSLERGQREKGGLAYLPAWVKTFRRREDKRDIRARLVAGVGVVSRPSGHKHVVNEWWAHSVWCPACIWQRLVQRLSCFGSVHTIDSREKKNSMYFYLFLPMKSHLSKACGRS